MSSDPVRTDEIGLEVVWIDSKNLAQRLHTGEHSSLMWYLDHDVILGSQTSLYFQPCAVHLTAAAQHRVGLAHPNLQNAKG